MEPYKSKGLPMDYNISKEILRLTAEANSKYGEYKSLINTLEFDASFFLDSVILTDSFKSTQIEGTQITQDEIYYLNYLRESDDNKEIQNLKKAIEYASENAELGITYDLVNKMHEIILDSVRGAEKMPGMIRNTQNWIGPRGCSLENASFIPPRPEEVYGLLANLYQYMNNAFIDPLLINVALSHAQFETIHAYKDGNGRLGRALIPVHMALLDGERPILYMSEVLELYKPSYQRSLMDLRRGNVEAFISFFLQAVIDQCNGFIYKINKIKTIYKEDMKLVDSIKGNSIYKIMPVIMRKIVFSKNELMEATNLSISAISNIVKQLEALGIIVNDEKIKRVYRYQRIYEVFC